MKCIAHGCDHNLAPKQQARKFCAWHWWQIPVRVRNEIAKGKTPATLACLMLAELEKTERREHLIENRLEGAK